MFTILTPRISKICFGIILIFGLFYSLVVPPFQSPDEINHNLKTHHLAQGHFYAQIDTPSVSLGGVVPRSLIEIARFYETMIFVYKNKANADTLRWALTVPLNSANKVFILFPNTARYAITSYLVTVPTFAICNALSVNPLYTMYIGRLVNFLFWFLCIWWGFRLIPVFKELYLFLCMLPGVIAIHATLSADTVSNGMFFLIFALFFDFKFSQRPISNGKLLLFFLLSVISTWNKIIYFPLFTLIFLVPNTAFGSANRKYVYLSMLAIASLSLVLWWNGKVNALIYPTENIEVTTYHNLHEKEDGSTQFHDVNPKKQIARIKGDWVNFFPKFMLSVFELYSCNNRTYISTVGWETKSIDAGLHIIVLTVLLLFVLGLQKLFTIWERVFLAALAYGISALFLLSQHLHWDAVGETIAINYLGKYYIAIYPLLFFAVSGLFDLNKRFNLKKYNLSFLLFILLIISHIDMIFITFERFFLNGSVIKALFQS